MGVVRPSGEAGVVYGVRGGGTIHPSANKGGRL
jgi:hypothetical protein